MMTESSDNDQDSALDPVEDRYLDISFSDDEDYGTTNATKLYMQKFQNKVDFSVKVDPRRRDKSDRATTDGALDRRTRAILFKMMSQGIFCQIDGCISTGKEANIYHVVDSQGRDYVVKVYMTSIMPFKARDKYVKGDFRMRRGYCKSTSWKLVSKWTEKEYRNLIRIGQSNLIPAPEPLRLKGVVLLMTFIGKDGYPAPKLKDAEYVLENEGGVRNVPPDWPKLYAQIVNDVRTLYQKCRLVHADLSEYNLLYMDERVWMIDVSQAVEHESPFALDYLRSDCYNVNTFFRKQGVSTLTLREFFEWVVDPSLPQPDDPRSLECLAERLEIAAERGMNATIAAEDDAFRHVNIPRHLSVGYNFVRDFLRIQKGRLNPEDIYYAPVSGLKADLTGPLPDVNGVEDTESIDGSNSTLSASESESDFPTAHFTSQRRPRGESPASRRARKKLVKDEQAEKRKTKVPKHIKRRKCRK